MVFFFFFFGGGGMGGGPFFSFSLVFTAKNLFSFIPFCCCRHLR